MLLQNNGVRLIFDEAICGFTELINLSTAENYIKKAPGQPVFELVALDEENRKVACTPAKPAQVTKENGTLTVVYGSLKAGSRFADMECRLQISLGEDELNLSLDIKNNDKTLTVVETLCPMLRGIRLGSPGKDVLFYPHHAGERTVNPASEYASDRFLSFGRAQTVLGGGVYRREINYCGLASMSWMYYAGGGSGLYIASHDDAFPVTGVIAETGGPEDPWMGFGFRKYHRVMRGESYHSGEYCVGLYDGDWHRGAKRYRRWIEPFLLLQENPAFLREEYALNQCYNFKKDGGLYNHFSDIPSMFEKGMEYGVRHMLIASWNRCGFDCNYPEYYPDMELGSAMDVCRGVDYVNRRGGFATFYINARLFDRKSDFYETVGEKMAIQNHLGKEMTERYGPEEFSLNCPSDGRWQKQLTDTVLFTLKAYGLKGVYLDQMGSAEPFPCYHQGHSHKDNGDYNQGYVAILKELKSKMAELDADAFLMTENCGDLYSGYLWGNLTWNGAFYDEFFNLYKYTFPEFVQVHMANPRSWVKDPELRRACFYWDLERAVLLGAVLWLGLTSRFEKGSEEERYMKQVLSFRKRINPYIASCSFRDDRYFIQKKEEVSVSCWESEREVLLLIGNCERKEESLEACLPFSYKITECFNEEGSQDGISLKNIETTLQVEFVKYRLAAVHLKKK